MSRSRPTAPKAALPPAESASSARKGAGPETADLDERLRALKDLAGMTSLSDDIRRALQELPDRALGAWFASEGNTVRAVLLCCLTATRRAALFSTLPPEAKADVVRTMGGLGETQEDALRAILEEAHQRAEHAGRERRVEGVGGREKLRALLQGLPAAQAEGLLASVARSDPGVAADLSASLLTIPKLAGLFLADRARLLSGLDDTRLALFLYGVRALHGESVLAAWREATSGARRGRAAEEMERLGPVAKAALEEIFEGVVERARREKARGTLVFPWEEEWVS